MKKNKAASKIVLIFLILLFFLLCLIGMMYYLIISSDNQNFSNNNSNNEVNDNRTSKEKLVDKYEIEIKEEVDNVFYVIFAKDLFDENGKSNKSYFNEFVSEFLEIYSYNELYIIDEDKNITLHVVYDEEKEKYIIYINDIEIDEFYNKVDGEAYVSVDDASIVHGTYIAPDNYFIELLAIYNFNCRKPDVAEYLGEGKDLGNGYTSYLEDSIRIREAGTKLARNIILTERYEGQITTCVDTSMNLSQIYDAMGDSDFGSVSKKYLGYRLINYYVFFYNDETSFYTYSYEANTKFENLLKEYIESKDLKKFVQGLLNKWYAYDSFEYDEENGTAKILYSTRGLEINITPENPTGITMYDNYYFTDYTKSLVKNGTINYEYDVDLVEKTELERRNNN